MLSENIVIVNKLGLHARAAAKFVSTATKFESKVKISKDDVRHFKALCNRYGWEVLHG